MADSGEWQVVRGSSRRPTARYVASSSTKHVACCSAHRDIDEATNLVEKSIRQLDKCGVQSLMRTALSDLDSSNRALCTLIGLGKVADASDGSSVWAQIGLFMLLRYVLLMGQLDVSGTDNLLHTMMQASSSNSQCSSSAFDPSFTSADIELLSRFGIAAVAGEGICTCHGAAGVTCLVVSPHVPLALDSRVVWQHWRPEPVSRDTGDTASHDGAAGLGRLVLVCNSFKQHVAMELSRRPKPSAGSVIEHDAIVWLSQWAEGAVHERPIDECFSKSKCRDEEIRRALQNALSNISIHRFSAAGTKVASGRRSGEEESSAKSIPYRPGAEQLQPPADSIRET